MASVSTFTLAADSYINSLLGDDKWGTTGLTFSAPTSASFYGSNYGDGEPADKFEALNNTQINAWQSALNMYSSVSGLSFTRITETSTQHADLRFAMSDSPYTAWGYFPSTSAEGGDGWFNNSSGWYDNPVKGNYAYLTFLHETGHTLGLEHPHSGNIMPLDKDSLEFTVMSYRSFVGGSLKGGYTNESWSYPQSPMMYDIAALQHLYGADYDTNGGNTTYSWSPTTGEMFINGGGQGAPGANRIFLTIWDGGGADTYDFSNYSTDLLVDLRPGQWSTTSEAQLAELNEDGSQFARGNIANALLFNDDWRSLIENAKGGRGDDKIIGNAGANVLWGSGGDDALAGCGGKDRLYGGEGSDVVNGGGGQDRLFGQAGDDTMISGSGADILVGGAGSDSFVFRSANDSAPNACDVIKDFVSGLDRIDLQAIDANFDGSGNQSFIFIGDEAFGQVAGQLSFSNEIVSGDMDGDGLADLQIYLPTVTTLTHSDFIL